MNEFAKRLKLLRTRKELSYEELAVAVGSTKSLMWRYENGKSDPGLPALIKLADYFGVTLDWLGGGETVDIKGVSVTLESIEKSYGDRDEEFSFNAPGEGKVFVICNFFAENGSDEDFNISSFYFQAYEDGFSIDENYFTGAEGLSGTASPGKKIKGALVYEVSEQFEELELEYEPSFWSDAKITFLITNE